MNKKIICFVILTLFVLWTMVFAASASISSVSQRPLIINDAGAFKSETNLTINNPGSAFSTWVKISVTGKTAYMESIGTLNSGNNTKPVHVLELNNDGDNVTFQVFDNSGGTGTALASTTVSQKKIRHWKVYVVNDMHVDVGFTNYQEDLKNNIWPGYIDNAFTYISQTNSWAPNDQFRYPIEGSYMLFGSAWNARNADWIETLKSYMANGRMAYSASYFNECMENLGPEELARFGYYSQRFGLDKLGTPSNKVLFKSDDPGLSWANIDAMAESGIKYFMMRFNSDSCVWDRNAYPWLFYMQGRNPANKVLAYDGPTYNIDEYNFQSTDSNVTFNNLINGIMNNYQKSSYPSDAILSSFCPYGDNCGINPQVKNTIQAVNAKTDSQGRDYVYPQIINSTTGDFFSYVDSNFSGSIPTYKGNIENWWNYGAASTAYETAVNKANKSKLPAAETFATFANMAVANQKYPYENLYNAYENMFLYDEHTWGPPNCALDDQWRWKRNTAITSNTLSDNVLNSSLAAINTLIPTTDKTIVVYNSLSWTRSDIVKVKQSDLYAHFDITDPETSTTVKYQKLSDGTVAFTASNIPGLGYKTFKVTSRADDPVYTTTVTATVNTLENSYFKITFDSSGAISSIIDKANGNKEMVDSTAPYKMNQFIYYTTDYGDTRNRTSGYNVKTTNPILSATLTGTSGAVCGIMAADGAPALGASSVKRSVILYDSIPRIDIINDVVKTDAQATGSQDEEGFFTFPLNVSNFMLKHEMPVGDFWPHVDSNINNSANEQFYTSSTDHYTVNKWIDASDQSSYGITLSPLNAPLVQYGQRRSFLFSTTYNTAKPWIYSYVFNNKWNVNFQKTQPGPVSFKYSLQSHGGADWKAGRADKFGAVASASLIGTVIAGSQSGGYNGTKSQFISIDKDNVIMTTAKLAEDNGEGFILRFNETLGQDTTVNLDLSWLAPSLAIETDMVENDRSSMTLSGNMLTFSIKGYGWKTIRFKKGSAPGQVSGVSAKLDSTGTQITWNDLGDSSLAYYEVFRSTNSSFTPGVGSYITSVSTNHYFDNQVKSGVNNPYYYKIRAVRAGYKGTPSAVAQALNGSIGDTTAPSAPVLKADYVYTNRVSVSWSPSTDNVKVAGYRVYRDGTQIRDVAAFINSDLDSPVQANRTYTYTVKAYDVAGNLSAASNGVTVTTQIGTVVPGNIAPQASITASSQYNSSYSPANVADGVIGSQDIGEWASNGELNPWIQLNWSSSVSISSIVIFDRNNLTDNANGGTLYFSDGSNINVTGIPADGTGKQVTFGTKNITWVKFQVSGGQGLNVGLSEIQVFAGTGPTPTQGPSLFSSGFESGDPQPTWSDSIEVSSNVIGYLSGINPECSVRTGETSHTGNTSLMFSGTDNNATTSFCYFKVFDVNIPITSTTKLSYWFYPQMALALGVAVDFVCTDGTTLRDSGAVDQNGISMHPGNFRGAINTWNQVQCNVGQWLNGKTIARILVGYDYGPLTGQFRGYIDDILINN
jgi:hypothetical protein